MDFDFNVKKLVGEAGSFISRAVQVYRMEFANFHYMISIAQIGMLTVVCIKMTEEVLYAGEKTTLDPQLDKLCRQADATKNFTQRLIKDTDAVLVPNPGNLNTVLFVSF